MKKAFIVSVLLKARNTWEEKRKTLAVNLPRSFFSSSTPPFPFSVLNGHGRTLSARCTRKNGQSNKSSRLSDLQQFALSLNLHEKRINLKTNVLKTTVSLRKKLVLSTHFLFSFLLLYFVCEILLYFL